MNEIKKLCRICLTKNAKKMVSLKSPLNGTKSNKDGPLVFQVLEDFMTVKVKHDGKFPNAICTMCLELLKLCYDFKMKFNESNELLNQQFMKPQIEDLLVEFVDDSDEDTKSLLDKKYTNESDIEQFIIKKNEDIKTMHKTRRQKNCIEQVTIKSEANFENLAFEVSEETESKELVVLNSVDAKKFLVEKPLATNRVLKLRKGSCKELTLNIKDRELATAFQEIYKCSSCPRLYCSDVELEMHKKTCENLKQVISNNIEYECPDCFNLYKSLQSVEEHQKISHASPELSEIINFEDLSSVDKELFKGALLLKYSCMNCSKVYTSRERLTKHQKACVKQTKKQTKNFTIKMEVDELETDKFEPPREVDLEKLSQTDREIFESALNLQYKCTNCTNYYSSQNRLKRHTMVCKVSKKRKKTSDVL